MSTTDTESAQGRPYRGSSPEQRREERREKLLDAAVEIFGTTGYRTASIDKICSTAALTKRYFYESFSDSEALLVAVYRRSAKTMLDGIRPPEKPETMTSEEVLQAALSNFFGVIAADPGSARIVLLEVLGVSTEVDALYRQTTSLFVDAVLDVAASVELSGGLAGPNRRTLAVGLVGAILLMTQHWLLSPDSEPLDRTIAGAHTILGAVAFGRLD